MARGLPPLTEAAEHGRAPERGAVAARDKGLERTRRAIEPAAPLDIDGQEKSYPQIRRLPERNKEGGPHREGPPSRSVGVREPRT
jgi:hypothetical protein